MAEKRIRATDRLSATGAVSAFVACFAVVASPSFFASLLLVATESSWQPLSETKSAPARSMQSEPVHDLLAAYPARHIEPTSAQPVGPLLAVGAPAVQISAPVSLSLEAGATDRIEPFTMATVGKVERRSRLDPRDLSGICDNLSTFVRFRRGLCCWVIFRSSQPAFWGRLSREALRAFRAAHQLGT